MSYRSPTNLFLRTLNINHFWIWKTGFYPRPLTHLLQLVDIHTHLRSSNPKIHRSNPSSQPPIRMYIIHRRYQTVSLSFLLNFPSVPFFDLSQQLFHFQLYFPSFPFFSLFTILSLLTFIYFVSLPFPQTQAGLSQWNLSCTRFSTVLYRRLPSNKYKYIHYTNYIMASDCLPTWGSLYQART